jgi:hypothetical protein
MLCQIERLSHVIGETITCTRPGVCLLAREPDHDGLAEGEPLYCFRHAVRYAQWRLAAGECPRYPVRPAGYGPKGRDEDESGF